MDGMTVTRETEVLRVKTCPSVTCRPKFYTDWFRTEDWTLLWTASEVCASAVVMVVMLDTPCSEAVWRVLATHSIRQLPLHFPSRASPRAITFQLDSTTLTQQMLTTNVEMRIEPKKFPVSQELWKQNLILSHLRHTDLYQLIAITIKTIFGLKYVIILEFGTNQSSNKPIWKFVTNSDLKVVALCTVYPAVHIQCTMFEQCCVKVQVYFA
jgi:hypothetical protein